ncbi:MAG: PHP domain-containing protein [Kiritimatiellae bacterium]|jgi:histidinol phosphatase-like PHP family hydrolase|nr:PHP domain-containing protein [Kiritimatiellia bacterium]
MNIKRLQNEITLFNSNLHIHTRFSACADRDMTVANIIARAQSANLKIIALVDHHHPGAGLLDNILCLKSDLLKIAPEIKVVFGAELSAYGIGKYSDTKEMNRELDYRLYACTHYNLDCWEQPQDTSPRGYARHMLAVVAELIKSGRADCIAHPFASAYLKGKFNDPTVATKAITDTELCGILKMGKERKVAWEINANVLGRDADFRRRYLAFGKRLGVTFYLGTDAHKLDEIDTRRFLADESVAKLLAEPPARVPSSLGNHHKGVL